MAERRWRWVAVAVGDAPAGLDETDPPAQVMRLHRLRLGASRALGGVHHAGLVGRPHVVYEQLEQRRVVPGGEGPAGGLEADRLGAEARAAARPAAPRAADRVVDVLPCRRVLGPLERQVGRLLVEGPDLLVVLAQQQVA